MNYSFQHHRHTRGDQRVRGKVLLNPVAFMDCNANSQTYTIILCKWTEIKIWKKDVRRLSTRRDWGEGLCAGPEGA